LLPAFKKNCGRGLPEAEKACRRRAGIPSLYLARLIMVKAPIPMGLVLWSLWNGFPLDFSFAVAAGLVPKLKRMVNVNACEVVK
jgi:hypothetical protein